MKKILSVVLSVILVISIMPVGAITAFAAVENTTEFAGGSGTVDDPYLISTKEHLNNVRNYLAANFKMINDIIFTDSDFAEGGDFYNNGVGWEPIGDETNKFTGFFDGNGHLISGIYITTSKAGLFGSNGGTIKKLHVNGSINNESTGMYAGGIAAYNSGTILCCLSDVDITLDTAFNTVFAGGIL